MSDRIVTSLPKCLSDSTMRGSRESLRSSYDSVGGSTDSLWRGVAASCESVFMSTSALCADARSDVRSDARSDARSVQCTDRRRAGHWKLLKRAVSRWLDSHTQRYTHRYT